MPVLEFHYDFSCPYAYLASTQVERLAARTGVELDWRPFLLGGVFNAQGVNPMQTAAPARTQLTGRDLHRWAEHLDVPLRFPAGHPNRTVTALRAAIATGELSRASRALFDAYWVDAIDVSSPEAVARVLDAAGLDGAAAVRAAESEEARNDLRRRTTEALERGIFGAPTFFLGGERYWGQDRLDFIARALGLEGWPEGLPALTGPRAEEFELWFDFSSPFAYLASTQAEALAARTGARLRWRPFVLGGLFKNIGTPLVPMQTLPAAKQVYLAEDMARFARRYGAPFQFPSGFPLRTVLALRLVLAAPEPSRARLIHAIYRACWVDDRDPNDPSVLGAALAEAGLDPSLLGAAQSPEIKQALHDATNEATQRGLCGAPTFAVGELLFWGQDRIPFVERALAGWRPAVG